MKIIIENELSEKQPEIDVHSFSLKVGKYRLNFTEGSDGQLKVYSDETILIEPRASNSFYLWSVKHNWEIGK